MDVNHKSLLLTQHESHESHVLHGSLHGLHEQGEPLCEVPPGANKFTYEVSDENAAAFFVSSGPAPVAERFTNSTSGRVTAGVAATENVVG